MKNEIVALVLMPFDEAFNDIYKLGISAAADEAGIGVTRIDEQVFHRESMLTRIFNQIDRAPLIIADMSGRNPNVFYEVGYAHAKSKTCILITSAASDIPFDLKHHRHIIYGTSIATLKAKLIEDILSVKETIETDEKPLSCTLVQVEADVTRNRDNPLKIAKYPSITCTLSFDIINNNSQRSLEIEAIYFYTGESWAFTQDGRECAATRSDVEGFKFRHLLSTPVPRMSRGTWARIKMSGKKWAGELDPELFTFPHPIKGSALIRIITSDGPSDYPVLIATEIEDILF